MVAFFPGFFTPEEQVSESEKMNTNDQPNKNGRPQRRCVDCHTSRTPVWRGGPAGPKSLCNACGIRLRKQRSGLLGLGKRGVKKKRKMKRSNGGSRLVSVKLGEVERAATLLMSLSSTSA